MTGATPTETTTMTMPSPMHGARELGDRVLAILGRRTMPALALGHLVWLCDGWHLAIEGQRLCDDEATASHTGPSYVRIVDDWPRREAMIRLGVEEREPCRLTGRQEEVVRRVLARYAGLTSSELRRAAASFGGAWGRTYLARGGMNARIGTEAMRAEFTELARLGRRAADAMRRDAPVAAAGGDA